MDKDYGRGCCEKTLEWLTIDESCFISFGGVLLLLLLLILRVQPALLDHSRAVAVNRGTVELRGKCTDLGLQYR
jgi:hypothetical protein